MMWRAVRISTILGILWERLNRLIVIPKSTGREPTTVMIEGQWNCRVLSLLPKAGRFLEAGKICKVALKWLDSL
jgi:hypothetical protein